MGHAAQQQAGGAGLGCTLAGVQVWSREADAWMHCALQDRGLTRGMFRGQDQVAPHDPSIVCAVPLAILKVASDPALNGRHSSSHDYPGDTWTCHVHLDVLEVLEVMIPLRLCSSNASIRPRPPQLSILRRPQARAGVFVARPLRAQRPVARLNKLTLTELGASSHLCSVGCQQGYYVQFDP